MGDPPEKKPVGLPPPDNSSRKNWRNRKKRNEYKPTAPAVTFRGGKEELDGNYFDCTGYGQSDSFMKTVQKIADYIGQEYKCGGLTRTEVMTQSPALIPAPTRPVSTFVRAADGVVTTTPPDVLDISDYQSKKKPTTTSSFIGRKIDKKSFPSSGNSALNRCTPRSRLTATIRPLNKH